MKNGFIFVTQLKYMPKNVNYIFSLVGVNLEKVDAKYGIGALKSNLDYSQSVDHVPVNATSIDDLETVKKSPEVISFLDESKKLRRCFVSMIDFQTNKKIEGRGAYKCFWDRNYIPDNVQPIGCPIRYVPNRAVKSYNSEISKEKYTITEPITTERTESIKKRGDSRLAVIEQNYYETDGVFCSFNCCVAFIADNKRNPLYRHSESLLLQMYNDFIRSNEHKESDTILNTQEIMPAPHWRVLQEFGGTLNIESFRESFNKILYTDHGVFTCKSLGRLYEDQIKF